MTDYTGMFEKMASDIVRHSTEDTGMAKEAAWSDELFKIYDKQGKDKINFEVDRAKARFANPVPSRGLRHKYQALSRAQTAKPTGFVEKMIKRKVFGK